MDDETIDCPICGNHADAEDYDVTEFGDLVCPACDGEFVSDYYDDDRYAD